MDEILIATDDFSIFLDLDEVNLEEAFICLREQYGWCFGGASKSQKEKGGKN